MSIFMYFTYIFGNGCRDNTKRGKNMNKALFTRSPELIMYKIRLKMWITTI